LLRVLLDATALPVDRGGVGRYLDNLIPALVRPGGLELRVVCQQRDAPHYRELSGAAPVLAPAGAARRPVRLVWEQTGLPLLIRKEKPDVFHSPHYTHPAFLRRLSHTGLVVTLHDATFFSDPDVHTRIKGPFFRAATRSALRRADLCIADSRATADELVHYAGASADQIVVAHLGVDLDFFSPPSAADVARVRATIGLARDEPYVAFLGTLEPRKNIPALIRGWVAAFRDSSPVPALVLAGGAGWDDTIDAAAAAVPSGMKLLRPGYVLYADLPGLLGGADIVTYPSLGEGFGLPVLEAMACGAAVLTTRRLSLAEVGGDAVEFTETDSASIAAALRSLMADPIRRTELGEAGRKRALGFSWDNCAAVHREVYERVGALR